MTGRVITALVFAALAAGAGAQEAPATLSLDEAVELARQYNPDFRARLNDEAVADWAVRSAYAAFLPGASVSGGLSWESGGEALFGSFTSDDIGIAETPAYYFSRYALSVGMQLSGSMFSRVGQERASRSLAVATRDAAELTLETMVTRQYLAALRGRDAVDLARTELERAEANLALADARYSVQSATLVELRQAEVERGRSQVELIRAENLFATEKLRLLQQIGLNLDRDVELTTRVEVFEPDWDVASLVAAAMAGHPQLGAARASLSGAEAGVAAARSAYMPSVSISTGLSGFTRRVGSDQYLIEQAEQGYASARSECQTVNDLSARLVTPLPGTPVDCSAIVLTDDARGQIVDQNRQFPFNFDTQPLSVSLGVSVPIFQGLSRQYRLEAAAAQAQDLREQLRGEELRIQADVETAYLSLESAYQAVVLEERNRALAVDQLRLARELYRVGSASFLELTEAETVMARADRAYLLGLYAFHEALAALEAAVGQDLTNPQN